MHPGAAQRWARLGYGCVQGVVVVEEASDHQGPLREISNSKLKKKKNSKEEVRLWRGGLRKIRKNNFPEIGIQKKAIS